MGELDIEKLKYLIVNGSPFIASIALAILDRELCGKVSEFKERVQKIMKKESFVSLVLLFLFGIAVNIMVLGDPFCIG
ncbi:MAG: hypothetical protein QXI54_05455 [Archaeoglobaceae archaeon]